MPTLDMPIAFIDASHVDDEHEEWQRHRGTVACRAANFVERFRRLPTAAEAAQGVADLTTSPVVAECFSAAYAEAARERLERWRADEWDWLRRS